MTGVVLTTMLLLLLLLLRSGGFGFGLGGIGQAGAVCLALALCCLPQSLCLQLPSSSSSSAYSPLSSPSSSSPLALLGTSSKALEGFPAPPFNFALHGADWKQGFCWKSLGQSPIDLPASPPAGGSFRYRYYPSTAPVDLKNDGTALALDLAGLQLGGLSYNGQWHHLLSITAKGPSEHVFAGVRMPFELHMVHKRHDNGHLVIVAIPLNCANPPGASGAGPAPSPAPAPAGASASTAATNATTVDSSSNSSSSSGYRPPPIDEANFNPAVEAFLKLQPPVPGAQVLVPASSWEPLDVSQLISGNLLSASPAPAPSGGAGTASAGAGSGGSPAPAPGAPSVAFYGYNGSTTAPPCAENVAWFVREQPVMVSDTQARYLQDALMELSQGSGNFRQLQPLGSRTVSLWQADLEPPPLVTPPVITPIDTTPREGSLRDIADKALRIASQARVVTEESDRAVIGAARAYREGLPSF